MPSRRDRIGLRKLILGLWLAAPLLAFAQPVRAEVRVSGQADAVIVETREATVDEVLAALHTSFNLHYRTSGALNRVLTGTYTGSLQRVIARLLEGHNYVMQASAGDGGLLVFALGAAGSKARAPVAPTTNSEPMTDPWLRAAMLTPSVSEFMTAARLGQSPGP